MQLAFDTGFEPIEAATEVSEPSRVRELTITRQDGTQVVLVSNGVANAAALNDTFVLATNSFTATGGDGYTAFAAGTVLGATSVGEQAILEDYIIQILGGRVQQPAGPANPQRVIRLNP